MILVKNHKFFPPCAFNAPLREFLLEFCNGGSTQKTSYVPTRTWKEFDHVCIHFNTIPVCDRWTDRQTDRYAITTLHSACIACRRMIKIKVAQLWWFTKYKYYTKCNAYCRMKLINGHILIPGHHNLVLLQLLMYHVLQRHNAQR